jgi:adenine-specific DNA-methyltransferase
MAKQNYNKLELTWIGKGDEPKLEPRILIENPEYSYGDPHSGNMLIHGDNLLALKALEQDFTEEIKCIYIDPPYNTGQAFEHYDDGIEHSLWLNLMTQRIKILYKLLRKDGVLFINLDEVEHAYCKIVCDEIFGRDNYIGDLIWQKRKGGGNDSRYFAIDHDYILVYAKMKDKSIHAEKWNVSQNDEYLKRYKEIDENGKRYYWDTLARDGLQNPIPIEIECPDGTSLKLNSQKSLDVVEPPKQRDKLSEMLSWLTKRIDDLEIKISENLTMMFYARPTGPSLIAPLYHQAHLSQNSSLKFDLIKKVL